MTPEGGRDGRWREGGKGRGREGVEVEGGREGGWREGWEVEGGGGDGGR